MLSHLFKLMKFEFKCTFRSFGAIYLILLAASFFLVPSNDSKTFGMIISMIYGASIGVLIVMNFVTIIKNFYSSMFQKTGYLTQTLPVKSWELITSKLLVSYLWIVASTIVLICSTFIIAFQANNTSFFRIMDVLKLILEASLQSEFWYILLTVIILPLESILLLYFIMSAVHTKYVRKYRAFAGIILFFAINVVTSKITNGLVNMSVNTGYTSSSLIFTPSPTSAYYFSEGQAWLSLGIAFVLGAAFFAGTCYILDHKLEIE